MSDNWRRSWDRLLATLWLVGAVLLVLSLFAWPVFYSLLDQGAAWGLLALALALTAYRLHVRGPAVAQV
jgi:hypothetical protein